MQIARHKATSAVLKLSSTCCNWPMITCFVGHQHSVKQATVRVCRQFLAHIPDGHLAAVVPELQTSGPKINLARYLERMGAIAGI